MPLDPNEDPLATEALKPPLKRICVKSKAAEADIDDWWDEVLGLAKADVIAFGSVRAFNGLVGAEFNEGNGSEARRGHP